MNMKWNRNGKRKEVKEKKIKMKLFWQAWIMRKKIIAQKLKKFCLNLLVANEAYTLSLHIKYYYCANRFWLFPVKTPPASHRATANKFKLHPAFGIPWVYWRENMNDIQIQICTSYEILKTDWTLVWRRTKVNGIKKNSPYQYSV